MPAPRDHWSAYALNWQGITPPLRPAAEDAAVRSIHAYRDSDARYTFPTLAQVRALCEERFLIRACDFPAYEMGERFPILSLEPRAAAARMP